MIWSFDLFTIGELQKRKSYTITQGLPFFDFIRRVWYNLYAANSDLLNRWEEEIAVDIVTLTVSFLISVIASVVANIIYYYICKWLNGRKK